MQQHVERVSLHYRCNRQTFSADETLAQISEKVMQRASEWLDDSPPFYRRAVLFYMLSSALSLLFRHMMETKSQTQVDFDAFGVTLGYTPKTQRFHVHKDFLRRYNLPAQLIFHRGPSMVARLFQESNDINRIMADYDVSTELAIDIHVRARVHAGKSRRNYKDYVQQLADICRTVETVRT